MKKSKALCLCVLFPHHVQDLYEDPFLEKISRLMTHLHAEPLVEVVSEPEPNGAPSYASRSATKQYRTAPLKGVWQHPPYFHNGSAETLLDVVETYNTKHALGLNDTEMNHLTEYLKSL